jgi:hypothetical protein
VRQEELETMGLEILPAEPAVEPVVLRWSTASEHERFGYHVYRGLHPEGPFDRLTEEVIPGGGTSDVPRHYRYEDASVALGVTYYYYVESVSTSGHRERLTPVRAVEARAPEDPSLEPETDALLDENARGDC